MPNINSKPNYIFVNCCRKDPIELNPNLIISKENNFFDLGLDVLEELAENAVFLCGNEEIETANENVEKFLISGKYPSGNSSAHINKICPIRKSKKTSKISRRLTYANSIMSSFLVERLKSPRLVRLSNTEEPEINEFNNLTDEQKSNSIKNAITN